MKKICIALYIAAAVTALKRVVRKISSGRTEYLKKRARCSASVKVYIRFIIFGNGEAFLLSERSIFINIFPKNELVVLSDDDIARAKASAKDFVTRKFVHLFLMRFGSGLYVNHCSLRAYTNSSNDDQKILTKMLKETGHTKELLFRTYPETKETITEYIDWFESETLVEPITIE